MIYYTTTDICDMQLFLEDRCSKIHKVISEVLVDSESLHESQYKDINFIDGSPKLIVDQYQHTLEVHYTDVWGDIDDKWIISLPVGLIDNYTDEQIKIWFTDYAIKKIEKMQFERLIKIAESVRGNADFVRLLLSWIDKDLIGANKHEWLGTDWYPVVNKAIEDFLDKNKYSGLDKS